MAHGSRGAANPSGMGPRGPGFRSGFVALLGRPNVGKSTLLNAIVGSKVSIVSDKVQTTRHQVRGVLERPGAQVVFVDTPGIHKPRTLLGERTNESATSSIGDVDIPVLVLDASQEIGRGDKFIASRLPPSAFVVLNKTDQVSSTTVLTRLGIAGLLGFSEYFPVSARTGEGVLALIEALVARLPEGPAYFPAGTVSDAPEVFAVAELVREQLLSRVTEEVPHSITCRVVEWEQRSGKGPFVRCEIVVERDSQKPIVIGRKGAVLKEVGIAVRAQLPPGAYLELFVRVDKEWQRRPAALDRLGF